MTYSPGSHRLIETARPVQSSIVLLSILGINFFLFSNLIVKSISSSCISGIIKFDLPLQEGPVSNGRKDSNEFRPGQLSTTQPRSRRTVIIFTAFAISLRVVLSGSILENGQCAVASVEVSCLSYRIQCILTSA